MIVFLRPICIERLFALLKPTRILDDWLQDARPETRLPWHETSVEPNVRSAAHRILSRGVAFACQEKIRGCRRIWCVPDIVSQAHELSIAAEILAFGYRIEFSAGLRRVSFLNTKAFRAKRRGTATATH